MLFLLRVLSWQLRASGFEIWVLIRRREGRPFWCLQSRARAEEVLQFRGSQQKVLTGAYPHFPFEGLLDCLNMETHTVNLQEDQNLFGDVQSGEQAPEDFRLRVRIQA